MRFLPRPARFDVLTALLGLSLTACSSSKTETAVTNAPPNEARPPLPSVDREVDPPPVSCVVDVPSGVSEIRASDWGLAYAEPSRTGGVVVHRLRGSSCDVQEIARPVAARSLLDIDDAGDVYVLGRAATSAAEVSSELPDQLRGVARIDIDANVAPLIPEGRGIWAFSVDPSGEELWVSGCGPTGVYSAEDGVADATFTLPDTLSQEEASVLSTPDTFWSVGYRTCDPAAPISEACGYALMRTKRSSVSFVDMRGTLIEGEATTAVATTVIDLGAGPERLTLARCGDAPCGFSPNGVVLWDDQGLVRMKLDNAALGARRDEQVLVATGTRSGVYVLLRAADGGAG